MQKGNLLHESRRSPDGLTKADKKAERPENIINKDFTATEPNKKWLTDITQMFRGSIQASDPKAVA
jgi:transposase InsO family protein